MQTIWKYQIIVGVNDLTMPRGASVLAVQVQHGIPTMWALVNPNAVHDRRRFVVYGTGHPIDSTADAGYVGTFQMMGGDLVWHVFEDRHN